jgi:hypothetical protein
MAINSKKGFALLIAVIFISVVLALGTALGSIGYKQQVLALNAARSVYAFYAANAALECALFDMQSHSENQDPYSYPNWPYGTGNLGKPKPSCGAATNDSGTYLMLDLCHDELDCPNKRITRKRFELAFLNHPTLTPNTGTLCADVTVYEKSGRPAGENLVFAQGYDVPCAKVGTSARIVTRGIYATF